MAKVQAAGVQAAGLALSQPGFTNWGLPCWLLEGGFKVSSGTV